MIPQGTPTERLRAGGAGIPAFHTPAGIGTQVAEGSTPWRHGGHGGVSPASPPKAVHEFVGGTTGRNRRASVGPQGLGRRCRHAVHRRGARARPRSAALRRVRDCRPSSPVTQFPAPLRGAAPIPPFDVNVRNPQGHHS